MTNFTATNYAPPNAPFQPGQVVALKSDIVANTSGDVASGLVVQYHVKNSANVEMYTGPTVTNQTIGLTPVTYQSSWTIPAGTPDGDYIFYMQVWNKTIMQTILHFTLGPAVQVPTSLNKVSGDQLGCTVSQAMVAPLVVQALDASNNPVPGATVNWSAGAGSLSAATSTTGSDGKAQVTWTAPSTPQPNTITATLGSLSAQFTEQSHMVLYGAHSPYPAALKALDPTKDPLVNGFIPDTGETWTLVANMSDEFDGTAIDASKWSLRLPGGYQYYKDELQRYVDSGVTVSGGSCKLTAVSRPGTVGHAPSPSGFVYTLYDSGVITTRNTVTGDYYSECRFRLPVGQGSFPAYWGLPTTNYQGETDYMEFVNNGGTDFPNMIHNNNLCDSHGNQAYWCDARYNSQYGVWDPGPSFSPTYMVDDIHLVACHKRADRTTIYLDGQPLSQRKIQPYNLPQQIIHNLAFGGAWATRNSAGQDWTQPISLGPEVFELFHTRVYTPS